MARFQFRLNKALQKQNKGYNTATFGSTSIQETATKSRFDKDSDRGRLLKQGNPRLPGFKEKVSYEVVLEWDLSQVARPFRYQRLGMKSWTNFDEAVQDITRFVRTLNSVSSDAATRGQTWVVRIVGIYEKDAFKDWSNDPYNGYDSKKLKKHIADTLAVIKSDKGVKKKRISYLKEADMKVR